MLLEWGRQNVCWRYAKYVDELAADVKRLKR